MTAKQTLCKHSAKTKRSPKKAKFSYIVYKTTCLVNNKIYIGVHKTENPNIFDGYIGCGVHSANTTLHTTIFHKAVQKYGYYNFKRETLFVYPHKKPAYKKEAELVTQDFIELDSNYNTALGGGGGAKFAKAVYQFDLTGKLICKFQNIYEAAKTINRPYKSIAAAIATKGQCSHTLWSRNAKIEVSEYSTVPVKTYYVYDSSGTLIAESLYLNELLELVESNSGNISRAIKLQNKVKGFFITTEKLDNVSFNIAPSIGNLNQYTADGNLVASYHSAEEAKRLTGLKLCSISQAIKLFRKCNGFYWTRANNPPQTINTNKH